MKSGIAVIIVVLLVGAMVGVSVLKNRRTPSHEDAGLRQPARMQSVTFKTKDGVQIRGSYYPARVSGITKGAVLLHMMPATKESWQSFADILSERYHVLAVDLRGHGESQGGPDGYRNFSDAEHQASLKDVEAAVEFLKSKGVAPSGLVLVGASIGANLSLWYLSDHRDVPQRAVLLSPGLNYRGIASEPLMEKLHVGQAVMLVGSDNDPQSDGNVMRAISSKAIAGVEARVLIYQSAGHGTDMFGKESPDLAVEIMQWLP